MGYDSLHPSCIGAKMWDGWMRGNILNIEHRTLNIEHRMWVPLSIGLGMMPAGVRGG